MPNTPWPRPLFAPGGGDAHLEFVVFAPSQLHWTRTLTDEGSPLAELPEGLGAQVFERRSAGEFAEWADSLTELPDAPAPKRLRGAGCWYVVSGATPSAPDLAAMQAAWALVRVFLRAGGLAVWDSYAMRWTSAEEALAADPAMPLLAAAFDVSACDAEQQGIIAVHTLGLAKFGRPDLIAFGPPRNGELLHNLVYGLALDLVEGAVLGAGALLKKGGLTVETAVYAPGVNGPTVPVPFFGEPLVLLPVS